MTMIELLKVLPEHTIIEIYQTDGIQTKIMTAKEFLDDFSINLGAKVESVVPMNINHIKIYFKGKLYQRK